MVKINSIQSSKDNPLFDLQRTIYSSKNYTRRSLHQARFRWVVNAIGKYTSDLCLSRAIEYGPGSGIYLSILAKHSTEVIGADIEFAYLSGIQTLVRSVGNLELVVDNIQDSRFEDEIFEIALCSEVIEHVTNPELALKTLYRILKPGGFAIITTPQRYSLMELFCKVAFLPGIIQAVRIIYREPILDTGHISLLSNGELIAIIEDSGFQIVEHQKIGLYMPIVAEFGGGMGGRVLEVLGKWLRNSPLNWMLWTQAYVLRKPI